MSKFLLFYLVALSLFSCSKHTNEIVERPDLNNDNTRAPKVITIHGQEHVDEYAWLRGERPMGDFDPQVLALIDEENNATDNYFSSKKALVDTLYNELIPRSNAAFATIPQENAYSIFEKRYKDDNRYPSRFVTVKASNETFLLFDENERAKGGSYFQVMSSNVSTDGNFFAWTEDTTGSGVGTLYYKELKHNSPIFKVADNVSDSFSWGIASNVFYYTKKDEIGRDAQIWSTNTETAETNLIHTVENEEYTASVKRSISGSHLFIMESNTSSTGSYVKDISIDNSAVFPLIPKEIGIKHTINNINNRFYVLHNATNSNFTVSMFKEAGEKPDSWVFLYESETAQLNEIIFLNDYLIVRERYNSKDRLIQLDLATGISAQIEFPEQDYRVLLRSPNAAENKFNVYYESLLTILTPYEFNLNSGSRKVLLSREDIGFDKDKYIVKRLNVGSHDGTLVPVTFMSLKETLENPTPPPLLLYVYGAYGNGIGPEFPRFWLSLIDRGFSFGVAHIRGGNELGQTWHDQAKKLNRKNAFEDFKAVINFMIDEEYTEKGMITIAGESAAGQPIGVAINEMPGTFLSVIAEVPFVDVVNSLIDDTLEFTLSDWPEFGNPLASEEIFNYMKSYSPVDNIRKQSYPNMYVTAGLNDTAVGYWEPMKWVYKIREQQTNDSITLLDFKDRGHRTSGKFELEEDMSRILTFIISTHERKLLEM